MTMFDIFHVTLQQRCRFHRAALFFNTPRSFDSFCLSGNVSLIRGRNHHQNCHAAVSSFIRSFVARAIILLGLRIRVRAGKSKYTT